MVYLEHSETLSFDKERIADAQILKGDVIFRHEEMWMYCDSAYFYEGTNSLDAFGHIRFVQGDTLRGFGDKLFYDGNTKLARMRQHVKLIHGRDDENPTILTTDTLNYDRIADVAYYYSGGEVKDSLNTLTSIRGNYTPRTNQAIFSHDVQLTNPKFVLNSDTLLYNTETKVADIISPTTIVYEQETTIRSSRGWYNTDNERSMLLDRSVVEHADGKSMTGDTIYYDKAIGFGQVLGHMAMNDTAQHATLYGEYGEMWEEGSRGFATDSALMVDWSDSLHIAYIHADTLFTEEIAYADSVRDADTTITDSTYRRVRAFYGVRVYRDDMQMTCDSMVYLGCDSTIYLFTDPICWSDNQQISADSMRVFIVNGAVDHAIGIKNALCVMNDTLDIFNQMSGKEITAYLANGAVHTVDVSGNALTVYYPKEDDGGYVGLNTTESSFIRVYVENQQIQRIRFTKETTGVLYPLDQVPEGAERLELFFWEEESRPISPEDVFRRTRKISELGN
jgi:lipopolysaccharide export system protein LptA